MRTTRYSRAVAPSVREAMKKAALCPDLCDIVVSAGTYQKTVTLTSGISIYGGFDQNDPDFKVFAAWMQKYQPKGDIHNSTNASVYAYSAAMAQVLKAAGDDLSRENILKQMTQLKSFAAPMLLPGVTMTISADNYNLFRAIQLMRFDGKRWVPMGKPVSD